MPAHHAAHVPTEAFTSWTLPRLVDHHYSSSPDSVFTVFPGLLPGTEPDHITYLEFGRAVLRAARLFHAHESAPAHEVVGIVASCDSLLYLTCIIGMMRVRLTPFPMSPRNSVEAISDMLCKVSAHRIFTLGSSELLNGVQKHLQNQDYALKIEDLPLFTDVYPRLARESTDDDWHQDVPLVDEIALSEDSTVLYLHSSGSTGFPKPIPWKNDFIRTFCSGIFREDLIHYDKPIVYATPGLPCFHMMAFATQLLMPLYTGWPSAISRPMFPNPPKMMSPAAVLDDLRAIRPTTAFTVPSILESWIHDPEALEYLATLDQVGYAGGPLGKAAGDKLESYGCNVICLYGATEFGAITRVFSRPKIGPKQWQWVSFLSNAQIRWDPQGDGIFELQLLRCDSHLQAVENLPDVRGYATSDLWVPHPERDDLWRVVSRVDDVVILGNGEKLVPTPTEGMLLAHSFVQGAVMFGRGRNFVGVLVEPVLAHKIDPDNDTELAKFRKAIWSAMVEANDQAPAFGQVFQEMILVTKRDKPLPRAAKGTVNRKAAIKLYEDEINHIYEAAQSLCVGSDLPLPSEWTEESILCWLVALANADHRSAIIDPREDLFQQGFDSLSVIFLRNNIASALRSCSNPTLAARAVDIGPNFIYANPTLQGLAATLANLVDNEESFIQVESVTAIRAMVEKYKHDMPLVKPSSGTADHRQREVVLLTGSTGGLGSQLLAGYLEAPEVEHVYALNRPSSYATLLNRHQATFKDRGLDVALLTSPKLTLLEGDTSQENFGLSQVQAEEMQSAVTVIIHNAWQLNFNLGLSSFEPHITGTRKLIDFTLTSAHVAKLRLLFTSSVSVAQSWPPSCGLYPEEPQDDPQWAVGSGYGESKYVAERLLAEAAERGLKTTSVRIGQISGGRLNGTWALTDWVPIMIASSVSLGSLPTMPGLVSWIPFDVVTATILDLSLSTSTSERALNIVHPRPVPWTEIVGMIANVLVQETITGQQLPLVGIGEWVAKLADMGKSSEQDVLRRIPALKLLGFFSQFIEVPESSETEAGGLALFATQKSREMSTALARADTLGEGDVRRWVAYWKDKGLFAQK